MYAILTDGDIGDLQNSQELMTLLLLLFFLIMVSESWFCNGKGK